MKFFLKLYKSSVLWWIAFLAILGTLVISAPGNKALIERKWQSEAHENLRYILNAEKEYHSQNGTYTACIKDLTLDKMINSRYALGFKGTCPDGDSMAWMTEQLSGTKPVDDSLFTETFADKSKFKALAVANLDSPDIWSIDEQGEITHLKNGAYPFPMSFIIHVVAAAFTFVLALFLTIKNRKNAKVNRIDRR